MITIAKYYTKKKNKRIDRTLGQMVKAKLYITYSHKEAYTRTLTKREKGKKNLYIKKEKEESNHINKQIYQC